MPACFQLFVKGTDTAALLNNVDEELCNVLGVEVHPSQYVNGWFDCIGFLIAMGNPLGSAKLREKIDEWFRPFDNPQAEPAPHDAKRRERMLKMLTYLEANYSSNSWTETGKRHSR